MNQVYSYSIFQNKIAFFIEVKNKYLKFFLFKAIFFLEFWKRQAKKLGHLWGVLDYEKDEVKFINFFKTK